MTAPENACRGPEIMIRLNWNFSSFKAHGLRLNHLLPLFLPTVRGAAAVRWFHSAPVYFGAVYRVFCSRYFWSDMDDCWSPRRFELWWLNGIASLLHRSLPSATRHPSSAARRPPSTVHRPPCTARRPPPTAHRPPPTAIGSAPMGRPRSDRLLPRLREQTISGADRRYRGAARCRLGPGWAGPTEGFICLFVYLFFMGERPSPIYSSSQVGTRTQKDTKAKMRHDAVGIEPARGGRLRDCQERQAT